MHLVVGLGNPGPSYAGQRHNVGFAVVDRLASGAGATLREGLRGRFAEARIGGAPVVLLEPQTYMNRSGESVALAMERFGVALEDVVVVHDDLDLPLGTLRLKLGGGAGGHNGLKSILEGCGGPGFVRLRIGIGRPLEGTVIDHVLSPFSQSEGATLDLVLHDATRAVEALVVEGLSAAMNAFNARNR